MEMIGNGLSLKVILRMGAAWERCWFQPLLYDMFDAGWSFQVAMNKQSNYIWIDRNTSSYSLTPIIL